MVELDWWDVKIYKVFNVKGDLEKMHSFATWTTKLTITTIVVRNAGCARSRYTRKLSLIFFNQSINELINQSINQSTEYN